MTPTALTDDLPADLIERVNALSPTAKGRLFDLLADDEEVASPPKQHPSDAVRLAWKEEIARRIAAYERGELETMTVEEVIAQLEADQREDERHAG